MGLETAPPKNSEAILEKYEWGPQPLIVSMEILTEHHKHVLLLIKDNHIEVLPHKPLNWPLVPIFWNIFTGFVFLGSKFKRSNTLHSRKKNKQLGFPHLHPQTRKGKGFVLKGLKCRDSHKLSVNSVLSRADRGQIAGGWGGQSLRGVRTLTGVRDMDCHYPQL